MFFSRDGVSNTNSLVLCSYMASVATGSEHGRACRQTTSLHLPTGPRTSYLQLARRLAFCRSATKASSSTSFAARSERICPLKRQSTTTLLRCSSLLSTSATRLRRCVLRSVCARETLWFLFTFTVFFHFRFFSFLSSLSRLYISSSNLGPSTPLAT